LKYVWCPLIHTGLWTLVEIQGVQAIVNILIDLFIDQSLETAKEMTLKAASLMPSGNPNTAISIGIFLAGVQLVIQLHGICQIKDLPGLGASRGSLQRDLAEFERGLPLELRRQNKILSVKAVKGKQPVEFYATKDTLKHISERHTFDYFDSGNLKAQNTLFPTTVTHANINELMRRYVLKSGGRFGKEIEIDGIDYVMYGHGTGKDVFEIDSFYPVGNTKNYDKGIIDPR
jgi:hypothetical protein